MKRLLFLLLPVFAAGCSTPPAARPPCIQYVECPDGIPDCQAQAKELCPAGFTRVDEASLGAGFGDFARAHFPGAAAGVPHIVVTCAP